MEISLAQRFPKLTFAKDADEWLEVVAKKEINIFQQLENRRIRSVHIVPMLSTAGLRFDNLNHCELYFNEYCKPEETFEPLGHEIAHTFHFDFTKNPPIKTIDDESHELMYNFINGKPHGFLIEDFCDAFSLKWMRINSKEKMALWCGARENLLDAVLLMFSDASDRTIHE